MSIQNKNYGKNINLMENLSGQLMSTLVEEAACFGSMKEYAKSFVKEYNCGYQDINRFMRTLRTFAINIHGKEWFRKHFNRGEIYLRKAAKYLGVLPHDVTAHISNNDIDLSVLSRAISPDDYIKTYNFFYTRCARLKKN